jgi:hypothetical protein
MASIANEPDLRHGLTISTPIATFFKRKNAAAMKK